MLFHFDTLKLLVQNVSFLYKIVAYKTCIFHNHFWQTLIFMVGRQSSFDKLYSIKNNTIVTIYGFSIHQASETSISDYRMS